MAKAKVSVQYVCQSCGGFSPQWMGKCPDCGAWNTLVEEISTKNSLKQKENITSRPQILSKISLKDSLRLKPGQILKYLF